uniref:ShKT domain-containing protein n=1 Tax=Steinernema glaseri TaxID=37863 RepID=A0A1I8ATH9_9BILA
MGIVQVLLLLGLIAAITGAEQCIGSCCDKDEQCLKFANKGTCAKSPKVMLEICPVSCGVCSEQSECPSVHDTEDRSWERMSKKKFVSEAKKCAPLNQPTDCKINMCYHLKYRSFDGTCNNLNDSLVGAAYRPFKRLLDSNYDDGVNAVTGSLTKELPNPRIVTEKLLRSNISSPVVPNALLMQWGQFLAHDFTTNAPGGGCNCTRSIRSNSPNKCVNIPSTKERGCITVHRSLHACGTGRGTKTPREQVNRNTPFIDASQVYGNDQVTANSLRERLRGSFRSARLAASKGAKGAMFPRKPSVAMVVGDDRTPAFYGLGAFHAIFLRLHNKIADDLGNINPGWTSERVFQETRKIVGAYMQVITYQEFLPALLGADLDSLIPPYSGYQPTVDPAVANEFAGAAFRLHGLIRSSFPVRDKNWQEYKKMNFSEMQLNDSRVVQGGTDDLVHGFISVHSKAPQRFSDEVTEKAFGGTVDLASINIQRGRDHGFQPYNEYRRKMCGLPAVRSFSKWNEVNKATREQLRELYQNKPENIDLYVGGVVEKPEFGVVGPTFSCIIADQFVRSRDGDRFYFENPGVFTPEQVESLKKESLASVLCQTAEKMTAMVPDAFQVDDGSNAQLCTKIPSLDLTLWKDPAAQED